MNNFEKELDNMKQEAIKIGYVVCSRDVHDILIAFITSGELTRDQVEAITIGMETSRAVRELSGYNIAKESTGPWSVRVHTDIYTFDTFEQAHAFALENNAEQTIQFESNRK